MKGILILSIIVSSLGFCSPSDPTVISGTATFSSREMSLHIATQDHAIIHWKDFSIASGERVHFSQLNSDSAVLNRVMGAEMSQLHGKLSSNGQVFLINPNGVLIGREGVIDTQGFIASTLDLSNEQFLSRGGFDFQGTSSQSVVNLGTITSKSGDIFLVGAHVVNQGIIESETGSVGLGQGSHVYLAPQGDCRLTIKAGAEGFIDESGKIDAHKIELRASNPYALAIKEQGVLEARAIEEKNGRIWLIADEGFISASGAMTASGGELHVLAEEIAIESEASFDVSGPRGGVMLIGGDERGGNPEIRNAKRLTVSEESSFHADGWEGDGGKIIFYATDKTHVRGMVTARALGERGDGGFIEVSAKSNDYYCPLTKVSTVSKNGKFGTFLIDPVTITIHTGATSVGYPFPTSPPYTYAPTADVFLNNGEVETALSGNAVTIDSTSSGGTGGDVIFQADITWANPTTFTVNAARTINIGTSKITNTYALAGTVANINLNALGSVTGENYNGIVISGPSDGTGGLISTGSGNITLSGISGDGTGTNYGIYHQGQITGNGTISLTGTSRSSGTNGVGILVDNSTGTGTSGGGQILGGNTITLHGLDSATGTGQCKGVLLGRGAKIQNGAGTTTITGDTYSTGTNVVAVEMVDQASLLSTSTGSFVINANSNSLTPVQCQGLKISNSTIHAQFGGNITIAANGQGTNANCYAVGLDSGSQVKASSGTVTIGTSGTPVTVDSGGNNSRVIDISGGSQIDGANITIYAVNNASSGSGQDGLYITDSDSYITSNPGFLSITGFAGGSDGDDVGIRCLNLGNNLGRISAPGSGDLTLIGTGGTGPAGEVGILLNNSTVAYGSGTCTVTGTGGTSGTLSSSTGGNHGISMTNYGFSGAIKSTQGSATVTGIAGTSRGSNIGIIVDTTQINVLGLTMDGTGAGPSSLASEATSTSNIGIKINASNITSTNVGEVSLTGTGGYSNGGSNYGIWVANSTVVTTPSAGTSAVLSGTAHQGNNSHGIFFDGGSFSNTSLTIPTDVTAITNATNTGAKGLFLENASILSSSDTFTINATGGAGLNLSPGAQVENSTIQGFNNVTINATARNTSGSFIAFHGKTALIQESGGNDLTINAEDGDFLDTDAGGSEYKAFGGTVTIGTTNGSLTRGGNITFQSTPTASSVTNTSGTVNLTTVGASTDITMNTSGKIETTGGNANLTAVRNIFLGSVNVAGGDIVATASGGSISNGTGTATTANLTGNQATLSAVSGIGSGTSSSVTAIGTQLTRLDSTLSAPGNIVIYEQDGLTLGTITTNNGGFDLNAGGLIDQVGGTVITTAGASAYTYFTTSRATTLGTASITNTQASTLGQSTIAGDYTFLTSPLSQVTIDGQLKVGRNLHITSNPDVIVNTTPLVGGTFTNNVTTLPSEGGTGNNIIAFGALEDFDISTATLATSGDITIDLRNTQEVATPVYLGDAVILNNNNLMGGQIRVTTVDTFQTPATPTDYNLTQTSPLILQVGQHLIINAARGANFSDVSNPSNPFPSPFVTPGSSINTSNGSRVTLTNANNVFPEYVRIKDSYTTSITSSGGASLQLEHVNTYGDFTATATAVGGSIVAGVNNQTIRSNATLPTTATVTLNAGTNTITIMPPSSGTDPRVSAVTPDGTSNGTVLYTSGSISGDGITKANNVMVNSSGMIGVSTAGRLKIDATSIVFASNTSAYIGMLQGATIAGESSGGLINLLTTASGNLDVNTVSIGALNKNGLVTTGAGNGITVATTSGNLTVNQPITTSTGNGAISLSAIGGLETINQPVSSTGGVITLIGNTGLTHSATGGISTSGTGTITATVSGGDITMVDGTTYTTAGGNITLSSSGNTSLGALGAGAGDIRSTASGGAITNSLTAGTNLTSNRAHLTSASGVGTGAKSITTSLSELEAHVTGTGGIFILESDDISLTNWDGVSPGISTNNGAISVTNSTGTQTMTTDVAVGGATNTLSLIATGGSILMLPATTASTAGGDATLFANVNVGLSQVNVGVGDAIVTATTGQITNNTGSLTPPNLFAATAHLTSGTGTGSGLPTSNTAISTTITNLTATANSGPIVIRETDQLNLNDIVALSGNVSIDAGGLVKQNSGTTLDITGQLFIETSRDSSIGTVTFLNNQHTYLGNSVIGGNWIVTTEPLLPLELTNSSVVGGNYTFTCAGTLTYNGHTISQGGTASINTVDPDLLGPTINAKGLGPDFDITLAILGPDPALTVNLRGFTNQFLLLPVTPAAITVGNTGNKVTSDARFITVDPQYNGTAKQDYNLVQSAPLTLGAGQTLTIAAARGGSNPGVSGSNDSMWEGSMLNGNLGSNITLIPSSGTNTINGTLIIQDPNVLQITNGPDLNISHTNTYGNLTLISTAGGINTGLGTAKTIRSAGAQIVLTAQNDINIGDSVLALDKNSGASLGEIIYTSNSGNIIGASANSSQGTGISFTAPLGSVGTSVQSLNTNTGKLIFSARDSSYLNNLNTGVSVAGEVTNGLLQLFQNGAASNLTVQSTTVGSITRNNLIATGGNLILNNVVGGVTLNQNVSAQGNTIAITADVGPLFQGGGVITTGTSGLITLEAMTGISGVGTNNSVRTETFHFNGINKTSGALNITNTLTGPNTIECIGMLINGPGSTNTNRNIYFAQEGGSSINFAGVMGNGTVTLLAIQGEANIHFSQDVSVGSHFISVSNRNTIIDPIAVGVLGNATFICDQASPTTAGPSLFSSQGLFMVSSNNLAIYASSGPQAPADVFTTPPNQVVLGGTLASLATWDAGKSEGLLSKYKTSYSDGGPVHGPGFGTNYTPGNGVFGSSVIWYKFNPDTTPPVPPSAGTEGVDIRGILRLIGINAWVDRRYFLNDWNKGPFCSSMPLLLQSICDKGQVHCIKRF